MEYEKVSDTVLRVFEPVVTEEVSNNYDYDQLKQQEVSILKSKNDFDDARDLELVKVRKLIVEAEKLGIKSKVEVELAEEIAKDKV
jgi:hypothetical protein